MQALKFAPVGPLCQTRNQHDPRVCHMVMQQTASRARAVGRATYGMANLRSAKTGLPFIVFISQKDDARHVARVKVSPGPKVATEDMGSYSISPFAHRAGKRLDQQDERLLERWIDLNRSVLQNYWDGTIEYTEDALEQIKSI